MLSAGFWPEFLVSCSLYAGSRNRLAAFGQRGEVAGRRCTTLCTCALANCTTAKSQRSGAQRQCTGALADCTTAKCRRTTAKSQRTTAKSQRTCALPLCTTAILQCTCALRLCTAAPEDCTSALPDCTGAKFWSTPAKSLRTCAIFRCSGVKSEKPAMGRAFSPFGRTRLLVLGLRPRLLLGAPLALEARQGMPSSRHAPWHGACSDR